MPTGGGKGGGSGKEVRAGGAFFEMFARDNLSHVLDKIKRKALAFGAFMNKIGNASALAGAGLAAPLVALFKGGMDRAAEAGKMSQQLGIPVELMSRLQYAAEAAGVSVDEVIKDTSGRFSKLISDAPGVSAAEAQQALQIQREMASATTALQSAMMPLLTTVTPLVKMFAQFVKENASVLMVVVPVAVGLAAFGVAAKVAALATVGLVIAVKAVAAVLAAVLSPVGLGIAAIVAVTGLAAYALMTFTETGRAFARAIRSDLIIAIDLLKDTFGGVSDALGKGDFLLAGKVAFAGLIVAFHELVLGLTTIWGAFKFTFLDTWHLIVLGAKLAWNDFTASLEMGFNSMVAGIINAVHFMGRVVLDTAIKAAEAMEGLDPTDTVKKALEKARSLRDGLGGTSASAENARIEADRKRREAELRKNFERAQIERENARGTDVLEAERRLKEARAELDRLRGEASQPAPLVPPDMLPPLVEALRAAEAVKGTFSGAALGQQFGVSSNAQKQTELQRRIADSSEKTAGHMDYVRNVFVIDG